MASIEEIIEGHVEMELENYEEKKDNQKTPADEQINPRDRLSDLPEFIIHHIFSFLDVKQSCVTACLSRRFYRLWSTMPVLDFDVVRFPGADFLCFIHRTMQRYEVNNTVIRKFRLKIDFDEYPACHVGIIGSSINHWVQIAVKSHVKSLDICILPYDGYEGETYPSKKYKLHQIVLSANKLRVLRLNNLDFIDFENDNDNDKRSINLRSLKCLLLDNVSIKDDSLLRRMISSCPLRVVTIKNSPGYIHELNFSKYSKIRMVVIRQEAEPSYGHVNLINLEARSFEQFHYYGHNCWNEKWPLKIEDPGKLLKLRGLTIGSTSITDEMVESLVPRLPLLERLKFLKCLGLKRAKISSSSLERFKLLYCSKLEKLEIDAPNLDSFSFSCYLCDKYPVLLLCKRPRQCKATIFQENCYPIKTCYFTRLWEFLKLWNIFNVLALSLAFKDKVEYNVEDAMKIQFGPPYKLSQLELTIRNTYSPVESAISAVIEGLFFTVHPSILSLDLRMPQEPTYVFIPPDVYKIIVQKLSSCRISWRHTLNGIEVESIDWDHLLEESEFTGVMKFGFNLCW